jgi:hypothetical protein
MKVNSKRSFFIRRCSKKEQVVRQPEMLDVTDAVVKALSGLPEDTARRAAIDGLFACFNQEQLRQIADVLHDYCHRRV